MDAAIAIREAISRVTALRRETQCSMSLKAAAGHIKSIQARRFAGTYEDLLSSSDYGGAARFFLDDLYSDTDYSSRDAQFARMAGGLQRLFPQKVVGTAVALARLHELTEQLDFKMATLWIGLDGCRNDDESTKYVNCWAALDRNSDRQLQLEMVLSIGAELDRLTKISGLRLALRMMRRPARAAGLGALQTFLESGFDTFAQLERTDGKARSFLSIIRERESTWIERLSVSDEDCVSRLRECICTTH